MMYYCYRITSLSLSFFHSIISLEEELQTKRRLEISSVTESKGEFITTHVVYCLVFSCI